MISTKIWETPLSWQVKFSLPVAVHISKTHLLKLPIDTTCGSWLVRKYWLRPPTPPYLREGLVRLARLVPPTTPCLSSDLYDAADRLDELLLRASPTGSSSIASDVVAELNDLVPPRPEPAQRSTHLAQQPPPPPAVPEEEEEPVVDAAQIV